MIFRCRACENFQLPLRAPRTCSAFNTFSRAAYPREMLTSDVSFLSFSISQCPCLQSITHPLLAVLYLGKPCIFHHSELFLRFIPLSIGFTGLTYQKKCLTTLFHQ